MENKEYYPAFTLHSSCKVNGHESKRAYRFSIRREGTCEELLQSRGLGHAERKYDVKNFNYSRDSSLFCNDQFEDHCVVRPNFFIFFLKILFSCFYYVLSKENEG